MTALNIAVRVCLTVYEEYLYTKNLALFFHLLLVSNIKFTQGFRHWRFVTLHEMLQIYINMD